MYLPTTVIMANTTVHPNTTATATASPSPSPLTNHEYYTQPHVLAPLTVIGISILLAIICAMIEFFHRKGWIKERPYPAGGLRREARERQRQRRTLVELELRRLSPRRGRVDEREWVGRDGEVLPRYEVRIPPPTYERAGRMQERKYFGGV